MPTVTLPVVGTVERKYLIYGGVAVAGLVGYVWWRRRSAPPPGVDTATGSASGTDAFTNPNPDAVGGGQVIDATGGTAIITNDQWANLVITKLADTFDPQYVQVTLGKYLASQPLSQDEANLVRAAWAVAGHPPVGDPQIVLSTTASTPGGPTPPALPPTQTPPGTPATTPVPPRTAPPPATPRPPRRYVVVVKFVTPNPPWASTLSGIAGHTGRSVAQLATWNGISNPNIIHAGQKIWVDPPGTYLGSTQVK